jgi:hypothetical protein
LVLGIAASLSAARSLRIRPADRNNLSPARIIRQSDAPSQLDFSAAAADKLKAARNGRRGVQGKL